MADHRKLIDRLTSLVSTLKDSEEHVDTQRTEDVEDEVKNLYPSTRGGVQQFSATCVSNPYRPSSLASHSEEAASSSLRIDTRPRPINTSDAAARGQVAPRRPASLTPQDDSIAYQPGNGKRYQSQRSKLFQRKGRPSKMLKTDVGTGKTRDDAGKSCFNKIKKTDSIIKDVFLIPSKDLSTVPRGKKRKEMYTNSLVATGVEFNILMEHWDIIQAILDAFSFVPEIGRHLGIASSYNFEFVKAIDDDLTILNPSLRWNLKMVRHVAGAGPLYIRFSGDMRRYLKTSLAVNHVSPDDSDTDNTSDTEVNSKQRSVTITEKEPRSAIANFKYSNNLSASSTATTSPTLLSAMEQNVPTTVFTKMESSEAKVSCPICHRLFGKTQIAQHADMCAETETGFPSYESAYDNLFDDSNEIFNFDNEEALNPSTSVFDTAEDVSSSISTPATRMDDVKLIPLWSSTLEKASQTLTLPQSRVEIRRKVAWQDFLVLRKKPWFKITSSFNVRFVGEVGVDGGGPKREFFSGKIFILALQHMYIIWSILVLKVLVNKFFEQTHLYR